MTKGYKPYRYGTETALNHYLGQNVIVNQTNLSLTDAQIEFLAYGLNYVTNPPPSTDEKQNSSKKNKYAHSSMRSYTRQIDTTLLSCNSIPGMKGHLPNYLINSTPDEVLLSYSSPIMWTWTQDPEVLENMEHYYKTVVNTGVAATNSSIPFTHNELLKAAKSLNAQDEFYITESDKGGVTVLWKRSDYEKEAIRQFSDKENYQLLGDESSSRTTRKIVDKTMKQICHDRNEHVQYLERNNHVTRRESLAMQSTTDEKQAMPLVYLKPKINKPFHPATGTFQARAVVSTVRGPLYSLDKYLSKITSPIMAMLPGLLKNSDQLIEEIANKSSAARKTRHGVLCPDGHSSEHICFASADVVAMYPSIDIEEGLSAASQVYDYFYPMLCEKFRRQHLLPPVDPKKFKEMMKFLFTNSFISYQDRRFYRQKKGTPMGGCMSAFFANCFMYVRTEKTIKNPPSWMIINQRFIDDFFFTYCSHPSHGTNLIPDYLTEISTDNVKCVQVACDGDDAGAAEAMTSNNNGGAKVTSCNFLDVTILFDPVTSTFQSKPYMKEFAVPSYIHRTSNNHKKIFTNVPLMRFHRLKRLSSSNECYTEASRKVTSQLLVRGYSKTECYRAKIRVDERQMLSALSTSGENTKTRKAIKRSYFTMNARYDSRTDWKDAQDCLNKIHDSVGKHYSFSKNKSVLLRKRQSKIVFSAAGPKVSSSFNRKFKYGL